MDSTIQVFLFIITVTAIAGFSGILYFLSRVCQALDRREPNTPDALGAQTVPRNTAQPGPIEPTRPIKAVDLRNAGSLEECLGAIGEKYGLASFTLATADGLLIGSTKSSGEDEAARYSYLYTQGKLQDETGAELIGIPHHGETVVGIARPSEHLSAELMNALERDTQDALRHWV